MNSRKTLTLIMAISLILGSCQIFAQTAEELFPKAIQLEEVKGELEKAIEVYQTIVTKFPENRPVAAKALLHIGLCNEKLGNQEAKKAYQQVIQEFADQKDVVTEARTRLAILERSIGLTEAKSLMVRKVWAGPEVDIMGEPSPDGKYLSYVDWNTGNLAIYEIATGKKRPLTSDGSWDDPNEFAEYSRWSPDGKQIVYCWYNDDNPAFIELRIIGLDRSEPRVLWKNEEMVWARCYDWSPDGKQILACIAGKDETNKVTLISVTDGSVRFLKELGGSQGWAAWPRNMRFSPDGHYIVYDIPPVKDTRERDIYLLSTDGSGEITLVEHPSNDFVLGWAPDGECVLFASERNGTLSSWIIQVAEGKPYGEPELVKQNMGPAEPMGFTQKSSYYYGFLQRMNDIYIAELDRETGKIVAPAEKVIRQFEGYNQAPAYSPDGKYLAYISRRSPMNKPLGLRNGGNVLCIKSLETGKERVLRPALDLIGYPTWSLDGNSIAIVHWNENDVIELYRIDVQTGNATLVSKPDDNHSHFGGHLWSPSGKTIYYGLRDKKADSWQIIARDLESGKEKEIYQSDDFFTLSISPDGQWLALCFPGGKNARLKIISTTGGESRELHRFEEGVELGRVPSTTWTADGNYILFGMCDPEVDDEKYELCRIPVSGGEPEKLGLKTESVFVNLSAHPDGRHIIFSSLVEDVAEIWVMENFLPVTETKK